MIPKFRAWDKENDQWYKPIYRAFEGSLEYLEVGLDGRLSMVTKMNGQIKILDESCFDGRFELMQSTGLHDKNGKEIFEGDILEIKGHPFQRHTGEMSGMPVGIDIDGRYVIEYNQEIAGYVVGNWKTREVIRYCTVIGNVHEHSHLLDDGGQQQ